MADRLRPGGVVSMILQMNRGCAEFYKGQTSWLAISFLYFSVMYISEMPWQNRKNDFQCHGNVSEACLAECYNKHFSMSIVGVWNTISLAVYAIFFMMEFSVFHYLTISSKYPQQFLEEEPSSSSLLHSENVRREEMILNLSKEKFLLSVFLAYYLLQIGLQGTLLIILWYYQHPLIKEDIWCYTAECHTPYVCVFMGIQEKLMSLILVSVLSVIIIIFCIIFFLYTVGLYTLTSLILRDTQAQFPQLCR